MARKVDGRLRTEPQTFNGNPSEQDRPKATSSPSARNAVVMDGWSNLGVGLLSTSEVCLWRALDVCADFWNGNEKGWDWEEDELSHCRRY